MKANKVEEKRNVANYVVILVENRLQIRVDFWTSMADIVTSGKEAFDHVWHEKNQKNYDAVFELPYEQL